MESVQGSTAHASHQIGLRGGASVQSTDLFAASVQMALGRNLRAEIKQR